MSPTLSLLLLAVAIVLVAFELHESLLPQYRPGCTECAAAKSRAAEAQAALRHDVEHKGFGFKDGEPDAYACHDEACRRNPRRVD